MAITPDFLRSIDWSRTPLGPMDGWPRSLQSYVHMILELPTPAIVFWGPEQTQIYNDGYAVIMGPRHPRYFGAPLRESWPDTYPVVIPMMRQVLEGGSPVEVARAPFTLTRHGFTEEAYFTFTFSPLRDDEGRIVGIYQPVVEMTDSVLAERRAETLRLLTARQEVLRQATDAFAANPKDIPFACMYLWNETERRLRVAACAGYVGVEQCEARLGPVNEAVARAFVTNAPVEAEASIATTAWPEPVTGLYLTPVRRSPVDDPIGVIAFGKSPRLRFDDGYRGFFQSVTREIGTNLAAQRAEQAEKDSREREQTTRREAESAKEAHARRLSSLFEHAPVGIAVLRGPEHIFDVANPPYVALLNKRALLQKPLRAAIPELAGQGIFELIERVYQTGQPYVGRSVGLTINGEDGQLDEERFFDFVYQPMPGSDGKTESIIVVVFDVTELSRARRDAEAANRAKDEFFAILGHELRNPLAPITTALQLMRLRGGDTLIKERSIIERQVGHITRLVDDLLDVSRITRGKVELKREPVELSEVVAKAIEMASPLLEQRRHHLEVEVPMRGLVVDGDTIRLAQVVANLLTNAAKYTESGGRVRISARVEGERVSLEVADNGIGIASDMLPRVFEPFAQEHQALDRAQGGLGLGLTIVSSLVKLHGGTVEARSGGRGQGSTFVIELPRSAALASRALAVVASAPQPRSPGALRVLIVDDNEDAADLLADALAMLGYSTRVAHDGPEAIRVADEFAPDVGLLDIGLPVMDGYELAGRLRGAPGGERLRLVAVTGYGQESDRRRAAEVGFDAHLVKPVQIDAVAALIAGYRAAGLRESEG
ncbi:MAG: hypothetical protein JWN44_6817 [Myxococcales bacterium]|nr:hypothetical protein [Myxococcales bacterium]